MNYIKEYKIHLFGNTFVIASREIGQKIIMAMTSINPPKFVLIGEELINTSSIAHLELVSASEETIENCKIVKKYIQRELTQSEIDTQKLFDEFSGKNFLLN